MKHLASIAVCAALFAALPVGAYYNYVRYPSRSGPYTPRPEKFDINLLPNKTVSVFVSDSGPSALLPNDSFSSILSQVRQATNAWNSVESSDLRVAFGGVIQGDTNPNNPGVRVVFDELPPGMLAVTFQNSSNTPTNGANGVFHPILQSVTHVNRDFTVDPGPSYLDSFFTTVVHELGHALGLQHTFTSSAMTVRVNRNVNRSRPLDADDIAGLSYLYPKAGYPATVGVIAGRVTANGQGVGMASVVALRPSAAAISTMTNPDGTYRLEGLPPDTYFVYVHPIPPGSDISTPKDPSGVPLPAPAVPYFDTVFYPGTRDVTGFIPLNVSRGGTVSGIDFQVRPRSSLLMYDGQTYSFIGQERTKPAFVNSMADRASLSYISSPATMAPVSIQALGVGNLEVLTYGTPINLQVFFPLGAGTGQRHLLFNLGSDLYVLPSALTLVQKGPPQGVAVNPQGDGTVLITGRNLGIDSTVYFDGLPARIRVPFSGNDAAGRIVVVPPTGFSGQRSTVTVFNADGQSSMILQAANPPVYAYEATDSVAVTPSVPALPAGASAMVEINGVNTRFVDGQVTVGFGTPDVFVRKVWITGPNRALVNVSVLPNASVSATELSVISGFQTVNQPYAFTTLAPNPRQPNISLPIVPQAGQTNLFPGAVITISGTNLAAAPGSSVVTLTDSSGNTVSAPILASQSNLVICTIPGSVATGVAILRLTNGVDAAYPVAIQIDSQPPSISAVVTSSGVPADSSRPVSAGEVLILQVTGIDPSVAATPSRLRAVGSGVEFPIIQVAQTGQSWQVVVVVTQSFGGQQVPVTLSQDGTVSSAYTIAVR